MVLLMWLEEKIEWYEKFKSGPYSFYPLLHIAKFKIFYTPIKTKYKDDLEWVLKQLQTFYHLSPKRMRRPGQVAGSLYNSIKNCIIYIS